MIEIEGIISLLLLFKNEIWTMKNEVLDSIFFF